ncbi:MurR/RpiR family transcriptional regulator [Nocardia sp. NBC_01503]|uniref:MurR/RpiR family transcriptional regulator n=1 Tax=Nocardia sp. NBC_01503 TaxID=2975997 RepID=UPI002E7B5EBB|nr:MurR/RpiR family transcriptional regulator [Nocardia sp. NBC_01503]WTL33425.1 MurR/RpiR family transcriptional regulator [Nocardia sp. NBC_01503]
MSTSPSDPPIGGTLGVVRSLLPSLIPSEQRVAVQFVEHPDEVALLSAADVAARAGTSPATVIRTCKSLGFKGFQHLRMLLIRDAGVGRPRDPQLDAAASREWVPAYFDASVRQLSDALGALDYAEFDTAATAIARARRVLIIGNGGSGPAAQALALLLVTGGRGCEVPADAVIQQLSARALGAGDVVVGISSTGENSVTVGSVAAARSSGATIIGISGYARSRLCAQSDVVLVAGAGQPRADAYTAVAGQAVQLLLLSALSSAVSRVIGSAPAEVFDQLMDLVSAGEAQVNPPDCPE